IKGEGVKKVTSYISDSVVLQSDADTSWHLNNIRWSIHDNFTYIAILQGKDINIDILPLFKGRLELNKVTGDLTIKNISSSDALNYRVDLIGKDPNKRMTSFVQLSVQERLGKPSIHLRQMILHSGYCIILLSCSLNNKTSLTWKPEHGFNEPFWSGPQQSSGESMLWASFTPNRVVNFSCIATDGSHTESCHKSVRCTVYTPLTELRLVSSLVAAFPYLLATIILGVKYKRGH
ncbi:SLAM family member 9-like, partial [Clarias magur]